MYTWTEDNGSRGTAEISTALISYLRSNSDGINHVITYSDNCPGQNKNIKMVLSLMRFISNPLCNIETIDMKFLVSGHTFLASDRDFALIEKKIQERQNIYLPSEYIDIITTARDKAFIVHKLNYEDFDNVDELTDHYTRRKKSLSGKQINWLKLAWIRITKSEPFKFFFKENIDDPEFEVIDIKQKNSKLKSLFDVHVPKKYKTSRPISQAKKADLMELLKFLPENCRSFYSGLESSASVRDEQ